jgi:hypothetical protein
MTELTAQELIDMRTIADDFFPDVCAIRTPTVTVGALGGLSFTWDNTYTDVACRLDPDESRGSETIINEALEGRSTWTLNIPFDQAIDITFKIRHQGIEYDIASIIDTNSYSTIRRASLIRTNDGAFTGDGFSSGFSGGFS